MIKVGNVYFLNMAQVWAPVCQLRRIAGRCKNSTQVHDVATPIDFLNVHYKRCTHVTDAVLFTLLSLSALRIA